MKKNECLEKYGHIEMHFDSVIFDAVYFRNTLLDGTALAGRMRASSKYRIERIEYLSQMDLVEITYPNQDGEIIILK